MPYQILVPPSLTDAAVIEVNGVCYRRDGQSDELPNTFSFDEEYESCDDCMGSSSSSSEPSSSESSSESSSSSSMSSSSSESSSESSSSGSGSGSGSGSSTGCSSFGGFA